jgi:hypothetical protein
MTPVFFFRTRSVLFVLIFAVVSTITYAFASSSEGSPAVGGDGIGVIGGYEVTGVSYQFADKSAGIASISFQLSAPAAKVQVRLSDTQPDWYECANLGGNNWMCNTGNSPAASANRLQVVAFGN